MAMSKLCMFMIIQISDDQLMVIDRSRSRMGGGLGDYNPPPPLYDAILDQSYKSPFGIDNLFPKILDFPLRVNSIYLISRVSMGYGMIFHKP